MIKNQRHEMLTQFQSRTAIFNLDECIRILEQFRWNCLEAISYVLKNVDSNQQKSSNSIPNIIQASLSVERPLILEQFCSEFEGVDHFERAFQERHPNVQRWPIWFKSSLDNAINQSYGPLAVFLNHDQSAFTTLFSRQILCSSSILNVLKKYKCILWPWDITSPINKQRLLERNGRTRQILVDCFSSFSDVDSYPLLLILSRQNDRIVLLDIINGNCDLDQTRACLEQTLNPFLEQSIVSSNESVSLSPGWVGGRAAGNIRRRPSFITTFRLSRPLRTVQRPRYISFYQSKQDTPEIIVSMQEVQQWLKNTNTCTQKSLPSEHQLYDQTNLFYTQTELSLSKRVTSPIPSLSVSIKDQSPFIYMSPRRAGWAPLINR